jgi:hypothetical protein
MGPALAIVHAKGIAAALTLAAYIVSPTDPGGPSIQRPHYSATPMPYEAPPPPPDPFVLQYSLGLIGPFINLSHCEFWAKAAMKPGASWSCWQRPFQRRQFCGFNLQLKVSHLRVNSYATERDCEAALSFMLPGECLYECPIS